MDPSFLFYLALAAVILILSVFGLIFLLPRLLKNLRGRGGGWNRLAEHFPANRQPEGTVFRKQTIQVGSVAYKNCATVVASSSKGFTWPSKLPFFSRLTPLLIPWEQHRRPAGRQPLLEENRHPVHRQSGNRDGHPLSGPL